MALISLIGEMGSGKTAFSTYSAWKDSIFKNRPIYSNYQLNLPQYKDLKPEILITLNDSALVIIDEAYNWLESRQSGRNMNRYLSYILFQSRKRNMDIILTDQLLSTIDVRFRQLTNYEIYCENCGDYFSYKIFRVNTYKQYRPITVLMPYSLAIEKIFPLYNTNQKIDPIDDDLLYNITQNREELKARILEITRILLKKAPARKYTHPIVEHYCLSNNYPKSWVTPIYNSIKASDINMF